tara:strand:+ start:3021 stop:3731 length:711 start_codon:yes stop_codon:yes gene_type:complete
MENYKNIEKEIIEMLFLTQRPVAVTFCKSTPDDVAKVTGTQPSSCSFWRLAAAGQVFFTERADHYNCAIGSYTHNIPLPKERTIELEQTLGMMTELGYIKLEEVPGIPKLEKTPRAIIYAPLGDTPKSPDIVLITGQPLSISLLHEAALSAGISTKDPLLGRPTCMALPATKKGSVVTSLGCIGNRVYTDIGNDNCYMTIAGSDLIVMMEHLKKIVTANDTLNKYHQERRQALSTS